MEDDTYKSLQEQESVIRLDLHNLELEYFKRQRFGFKSDSSHDKPLSELEKEIDEKKSLLGNLSLERLRRNGLLKNLFESEKISKEKFNVLKPFAEQFISFIAKLQNDKNFCDFLMKNEAVQKLNFANAELAIRNIFIMEIAKCFHQFSDLKNSQTKEFFALLYLQSKVVKPSF